MFVSDEQYAEILKDETKKNVIQALTKKKPFWPVEFLNKILEQQQKFNNFLVILRLTNRGDSKSIKSSISSCDLIGNKFSELFVLHLSNTTAQTKKNFEILALDYLTILPDNEDKTQREPMLVISPFSASLAAKSSKSGKCEFFKIESENTKKFDKKLIQYMKSNYDEFLKTFSSKGSSKPNKNINQNIKIKFFKPSDAETVDWTRFRPKISKEEVQNTQSEEGKQQKQDDEKPFYMKYWYLIIPAALVLMSNFLGPQVPESPQGQQQGQAAPAQK